MFIEELYSCLDNGPRIDEVFWIDFKKFPFRSVDLFHNELNK